MDLSQDEKVISVEESFRESFGHEPTHVVRAPGRVNLIGEHTDYNDGFVFPAAIERDMKIAISPRTDGQARTYAVNFSQPSNFEVNDVQPTAENREKWSNYLRAMVWVLQQEGMEVPGFNLITLGNVPLGSGLSSSAALLVAAGKALGVLMNVEIDPVRLALLAQRAEREFVGVNVGIMDQFISSLGQKSHALLIDTRSLAYEAVPLPKSGVSIVIGDTNKKRGLVGSEYNTRRAECERSVEILKEFLPGIKALRDVTLDQFNTYSDRLPELTRKRARHVVTEDARTLESVKALKAGDIARFGVLMNESHESLKDDYEVSCDELDVMVEEARKIPGVFGSRMTGAGFGGCTVSLVADEAVEEFRRLVPERYEARTGLAAGIIVTTAAQGAEILR